MCTKRCRRAKLTLSHVQRADVGTELVDRLDVLVVLDTVVDDTSTRLQVSSTVLESHRTDGDARIHSVVGEIESSDRARVHAASLLLERRDDFNRLDLRCTRYSSGREYGTEGVESKTETRSVEDAEESDADLIHAVRPLVLT